MEEDRVGNTKQVGVNCIQASMLFGRFATICRYLGEDRDEINTNEEEDENPQSIAKSKKSLNPATVHRRRVWDSRFDDQTHAA